MDPAGPHGSRVPATGISLAILVCALGLAAAAVAGLPPRSAPPETAPVRSAPLLRDVLTGRRTGADGRPAAPLRGPGSDEAPLRVRFVPSTDTGQSAPAVEALVRFLEARTGYRMEGATLRSYGLVVQELVQGRSDVAFLTATSYARARLATEGDDDPDNAVEAILQVARQGSPDVPGSEMAYRAALLVRADSPLGAFGDIDDATRVAMGPRTSGAGSILPSALFNEHGVHPRIQRYERYPTIISAVLQGAVDVGCIWWSPPNERQPENDARQTAVELHPNVFEDTRIIGFTGWMPNEPVVVRAALPETVKRDLARATALYVVLKSLSDEGLAELAAVGSVVGYLPATNADFDVLMETIELAFANDPEGWADFQAAMK